MSRSSNYRRTWSCYLLVSAVLATSTAYAAIDISQAPLETGTTVPPNILFLLDDSYSMRYGFMPDELFPLNSTFNSTCNSAINYAGATPKPCDDTNRKYLASNFMNKVYYDPNTTYRLPKKPDESGTYPQPSYTNAPHNGYDPNSTKVNLSSGYRMLVTDNQFPNNTNLGYTMNYMENGARKVAGAFYYNYIQNCSKSNPTTNDQCYTLVKINDISNAQLKAAQQQNFAVWFSFYRTRLMASKAGISDAFVLQGDNIRVGYSAINDATIPYSHVANFGGDARKNFFIWLHEKNATGYTPLRNALQKAGDYYEKDDTPWRTNPTLSESALLECRQSFTIMMTDGYYNSDSSSVGNRDNTDGPLITGPNNKTFRYLAKAPFKDNASNTLGDIAMNFWNRDLRRDLANTVPFTGLNPAFWQHMVTFGIGLGVVGSADPTTAFNSINTNSTVDWGSVSNNSGKINDLLHAAVNSRGGFFTADKPDIFAARLAATLSAILERVGASSNIAATAINSLQTESNLFQARFLAGPWSGDLWSYEVTDIGTPVWKASEKLPLPAARNIIVGNASSSTGGRDFLWGNLTTAEQTSLGGAADIIDYLRGSNSKEKLKGGNYRDRVSPLGDLVNSSPELVGEPIDMSYHRYSWAGASTYRAFLTGDAKTRMPMIYVGANDGMLHGFNSSTGVEMMAFIPQSVLNPIDGTHNVLKKYSEPNYVHRFSVDGSPVVADVYINSQWKSVLVGGMGRGGNTLFALDVTDPEEIKASSVLWNKSYAELGVYLGKPQVHRLENGSWAILVGYGYNNSTHQSGLLVIDVANGDVLAKIPTGKGTSTEPNGISEVNVLDTDSDGNIDWVYGGDMLGYVWKFDLTAASAGSWAVANSGAPMFRALDSNNNPQMITGGVMSSVDPKTGKGWVFFGTGRYLNQDDPSNSQQQSWYGIIDGAPVTGRSELAARVMSKVGEERVVTSVPNLEDGKKGWFMDLIDSRERIVDLPVVIGGDLVMNTMIPDTNVCNPSGSGYVMAISPYTGGRLNKTFFDVNNDGKFTEDDQVTFEDKKVHASMIKVGSLNSVVTFTKKGSDVVALVNCENANVCEEPANVNRNSGLQSWHEISF